MKTIRVNEKLAEILEDVPKSISHANWILDKLQRLIAHEENAMCWIVSTSNVGSNRMSVGDENGSHPIFDEVIEIVLEIPRTNMSHEEREDGWLGQNNDYSSYAHGGFASIKSAQTYIINDMGGRLIPDDLKREHIDEGEIYTTAEFNEYWFIVAWLEPDMPNVEGLSDEAIEKLAEKIEGDANDEKIGILGDIEEYLMELRNSR